MLGVRGSRRLRLVNGEVRGRRARAVVRRVVRRIGVVKCICNFEAS